MAVTYAREWDLSDLYNGLDDPRLQQDLRALQDQASAFRQQYRGRVGELTPAAVRTAIQTLEYLWERVGYCYAYPSLIFAADTRNTPARQVLDQVMQTATEIENQVLFFSLELQQLPAERLAALQEAAALVPYAHYLERVRLGQPYQLPEAVEQTRNQDSLTGRQAFIQLRSVHQGALTYRPVTTPEGTTATLEAELGALLFHADGDTRYQAYTSIREQLAAHNLLYGYILNTVAQDHRLENQMRGHASTLAKQLLVDEVPEGVFWSIMRGTETRYDLFQRYYQRKGEALGRKIRTCDVLAPWPSQQPVDTQIDYDRGIDLLLAALGQFSETYRSRSEQFFQRRWVDAQMRPGKQGGAFCSYIHGKNSYLLLSYADNYNSLFTLAHEMGHGLHFAWIGEAQTYFNSNPPMVLAEVASVFNELLLLDYLLAQASDQPDLQRVLLVRLIEDQLSLIFRQSTISRLELAIHERAVQGSFDQEFVNKTWTELYQQLCGSAVEVLPEHGVDWARVGHIFFKPYYCYQYTASSVVSLACYQQYRQQGQAFIPGYLQLLAAGGSQEQMGALRQYVGVDLTQPETIARALDTVAGLIDRLEASL
ncbi:pepF/M3 family oligoendopeptidase [Gloeomargarita lithophora Alchichica-D10]|uniref:PepF/M3 family oligoendopeptidase n=1 Tax=Gloeomargarita lithophora Alchichica-D10 TaxID=1188229 RepID=A0A1J0AAX3_9CYAN|nr:M3 family metallopeptidase [Gloeomargarita lithophora]APB33078.1 pepF/M3 family oligoendopeptidase [Gloeomargarita lithophora Alchichica-D10]